MSRDFSPEDKGRVLRALAFEIRRKRPADEALASCIESEGRGGRHRPWRPISSAPESEGFLAALKLAGLVGDEAAVVLTVVIESNDHRLLGSALAALADYVEQQTD